MVGCILCKRSKQLDDNGKKIHYFRFPNPKDMTRQKVFDEWLKCVHPQGTEKSRTQIYNTNYVCSFHFDERDIINDCARVYLKRDAVPKPFKPLDVTEDDVEIVLVACISFEDF